MPLFFLGENEAFELNRQLIEESCDVPYHAFAECIYIYIGEGDKKNHI